MLLFAKRVGFQIVIKTNINVGRSILSFIINYVINNVLIINVQ